MNRRSKTSAAEDSDQSPVSDQHDGLPAEWVRTAVSIWLPVHLFALLVSFSAVVEPSSLQSRLERVLVPYLQLIGCASNQPRPFYLAHGESDEQPHRLEVTRDEIQHMDADVTWQNPHFGTRDSGQITIVSGPAATPGLAVSDRYQRWLSMVATLADQEQPSLVAELLLPVLASDPSIRGVRIVRIPTDLASTIDDQLPPPYVARVIGQSDRASLVQLRATRLSAVTGSGE